MCRDAWLGVLGSRPVSSQQCFLECTFNWLDYSTGIKDETQTHCFTGFSRMVSLVIPNVGFASLLTQSPHLILGCAWTAANTNSCCLLETQTLFWPKKGETKTLFWHDDGLSSQKHSRDCLVSINSQTILMSQTLQRCRWLHFFMLIVPFPKADRLLSIAESLGFWFAFLHCKLSLLFPRLVDWCRFSTLGAQETHSIDSIARCLGVFAFLPTQA